MSASKHKQPDFDGEDMNEHITASELAKSLHNLALSKEARRDQAYYDELDKKATKIINEHDSKI